MPRATNEITNKHLVPPAPKHLDCLTHQGHPPRRRSLLLVAGGRLRFGIRIVIFPRIVFQRVLQTVPATALIVHFFRVSFCFFCMCWLTNSLMTYVC